MSVYPGTNPNSESVLRESDVEVITKQQQGSGNELGGINVFAWMQIPIRFTLHVARSFLFFLSFLVVEIELRQKVNDPVSVVIHTKPGILIQHKSILIILQMVKLVAVITLRKWK